MNIRMAIAATAITAGVALASAGCAGAPPVQQGAPTAASAAPRPDGFPVWIDDACDGQPAYAICAVGESELVAANAEAGKTDAEAAAQNRLQAQIELELGRLLERYNEATRDLTNGRFYGQQTIKDINRNFSEKTLRGVRFAKYYYHPNRMKPEKVFVLAVVTPDTIKMSADIQASLLAEGERNRLINNHNEAQNRYDAVRKEYLAEKAAKAAPATAPSPTTTNTAPPK